MRKKKKKAHRGDGGRGWVAESYCKSPVFQRTPPTVIPDWNWTQAPNKASGSHSVVPRSVASAAFGNLLEFRHHPRPSESDAVRVGPGRLFFNKSSR